jgi:hypothetical protein
MSIVFIIRAGKSVRERRFSDGAEPLLINYQLRVIYQGRAHINDDRSAQCFNDEAATGIREMIVIVLTN